MVGQTEGAVRKAVERQSIVKGLTADKKYIPAIASAEWGKAILPEYMVETVVPAAAIPPKKKAGRPLKEKPDPRTADEFVAGMMAEPLPEVTQDEVDQFDETQAEALNNQTTKIEAERRIAIFKAKMAEIALREKQGELLPRAKLEKVLYGYGQEIRTMISAITAQVIDKIRACDDRHEAVRVLDNAIHEALNVLTDIEGREL
jgi:hypothetical protein